MSASSTPSPFAGTSPVASLAHADGSVTLVEGQTFAVSTSSGDMHSHLPHGLFVLDTRVLSHLEVRVNEHRLEALTVETPEPFAARFVGRGVPVEGHADADLVVFRDRHIGRGMRELISVTNHGLAEVALTVDLICDADFADLFEVKESRVEPRGRRARRATTEELSFDVDHDAVHKRATLSFSTPPTSTAEGHARWRTELGPGASFDLCVELTVELDGAPVVPRFTCGGDDAAALPTRRIDDWRAQFPSIETDHPGFAATISRTASDLGALRIFDPEHPDRPILAAGAPWFMTVFGRDSLLTSWMTLIADPSLAHGVLETLAQFQGTDVDPATEEQPGKILHEMRFGAAGSLSLGGGDVYYGTVDATPLFVMLLGELRRWDPRDEIVDRLLPHADRALEWIERFGDRDGDGYVEYRQSSEQGLANQGWKDSWDAVRRGDGSLADAPIALCEVQGYVYSAYVARAHLARQDGDRATFEHWAGRAGELRKRFNEDFWLDEHGTFALALDADKRPVDVVTSNPGHCLWTGIVDPEKAPLVADRLMAEDMFSGFGIRTLASTMPAYNPVSYHNGSIWPHDNALCAAGLARYGFTDHLHRVIEGQLAVAGAQRGTLPELFAGFPTAKLAVPAPYPTSCSPQAWAAASPLLWLRSLLGLDPWSPHGRVWLHPSLPPSMNRLRVEGIPLSGHTLTVDVDGGEVTVDGAGDLDVVDAPRPPLTAVLEPWSAD